MRFKFIIYYFGFINLNFKIKFIIYQCFNFINYFNLIHFIKIIFVNLLMKLFHYINYFIKLINFNLYY